MRKEQVVTINHLMTAAVLLLVAGTAAMAQSQTAGRGGQVVHAPSANMEPVVAPATHLPPVSVPDGPVVQVALLLDTSNSMDGLIEQAKATLWSIVNELGVARDEEGRLVQLQVALYEYGNNGIPAEVGHIRQRAPFTTDLDVLSEQLFGLRTWGGQEYCGAVVHRAMRELRWWRSAGECLEQDEDGCEGIDERKPLEEVVREGLVRGIEGGGKPAGAVRVPVFSEVVEGPVIRILVVAGNEPFTQGTVAYQEAIGDARSLGVVVNTIFCGDRSEGERTGWSDGAALGGGVYANIDQNEAIAQPPTPYDERLAELNASLNATYLAYGDLGEASLARQVAADRANAAAFMMPRRAEAKARAQYANAHWDLVDAVEQGKVEIGELREYDLPEELHGLSEGVQLERIREMAATRKHVQGEILRIAAERERFLAEQMALGGTDRLDQTLVTALREQLLDRGLLFDPEKEVEPAAE